MFLKEGQVENPDFTIADIVGLGIGFMSAALTLVGLAAAVIIFFLGVRHSRHLSEVEIARRDLVESTRSLKLDVERSASLLQEVHLGFEVLRSVATINSQLRMLSKSNVSDDKEIIRLNTEITKLRQKIQARDIELQILVSGGQRCNASLIGLSQTFGDHHSVEFLATYAGIIEARGGKANHIHSAKWVTEARLAEEDPDA